MSWNDENVAKLRDLWDQGLPTAQIGKLLGFTKNAVVGKAHRIGLERRPSPIKRNATKPDRKKARSPVVPSLNFENEQKNNPDQFSENANGVKRINYRSIFNSRKKQGCEWPSGHPNENDFHFCGNEVFEDKPYCLYHCSIAYVLPEKNRELEEVKS